jgi:hypothetical protein
MFLDKGELGLFMRASTLGGDSTRRTHFRRAVVEERCHPLDRPGSICQLVDATVRSSVEASDELFAGQQQYAWEGSVWELHV